MKPLSNPLKEKAAQLLAEGELEQWEIAEKVGVDRVTIYRWGKDERFRNRVEDIVADISAQVMQFAIARKNHRVRTLARLNSRLHKVIEERAKDESLAEIPGGKTGLIVRKPIASGGMCVGYEYAVDAGTIRQIQSIHEQVAKELGQIVDKRELTGKDGGPLTHEVSAQGMTNEQIESELKEIFGTAIAAGTPQS